MQPDTPDVPVRRVAITGLGAVTPLGIGVKPFWEGLLAGRSGIRPLTFFDTTDYSSKIAGEVPDFDYSKWVGRREANRMDRFALLAIAAAYEALEDAGVALRDRGGDLAGQRIPADVDPRRFGCFIGSGIGGLGEFEKQHTRLMKKGPRKVSAFTIPKLMANSGSGEVSLLYGLMGPNFSAVSACASAAHSIGEAFRCIRRGHADIMLAGGSEASITPLGVAGFCSLKALSTRNDEPERASRPFDKNRDGFVIGEGAGVVTIEELEHAKRRGARIYAELAGYGASGDAYHITQPCPDADGAVRAMSAAMEDAGFAPEDVDYVNAHGTSTYYNDRVETLAIKKALGEERARKIAVSATKSMVGHSLGASGGMALVATALTVHERKIHPTINYETPDPECDLDYVPNVAREGRVRGALLNSLGFGGHNATLAVREYADA
ncbi:MAG: beta-ketoacyl-ACP synthase II [Planctomycetota bacterium]|jgi:3-oxoacyl-[acyl-carrier-protein] synthase II